MKTQLNRKSFRFPWRITAIALVFAAAAACFAAARNSATTAAQEKELARTAADQSTSLNDQTDLALTVYNSNIALIRDVRQLTLPTGLFRLKLMDIAATVNPRSEEHTS